MVKADAILAQLQQRLDFLLVDDSREIEETHIEVLDEASRFENAVQGGLERSQAGCAACDGCEFS